MNLSDGGIRRPTDRGIFHGTSWYSCTVYAYLIRSCSPHTSTHLHIPVDKRMRTNLLDRGIGAASSGSTRWRRAALRHLAHPSQPAGLCEPAPASACICVRSQFFARRLLLVALKFKSDDLVCRPQWCKASLQHKY